MNGKGIADVIGGYTYRYTNEKELQAAIAEVLREAGIQFEREFHLANTDIIDFYVYSGIGMEVKVGQSFSDVVRQIHRYAQYEQVKELVLVTTKLLHQVPNEINGKPVITVNLAYSNL